MIDLVSQCFTNSPHYEERDDYFLVIEHVVAFKSNKLYTINHTYINIEM